jgi:leucyl aminopeptidase
MTVLLKKPVAKTTPIHVVDRASFATHLRTAAEATRRWLQATGFQGEADRHVLVPAADGSLKEVWAGVDAVDSPWALSALPLALPGGNYRIAEDGLEVPDTAAALSWELGAYRFDAYKAASREPAALMLAPSLAAERGLMLATAAASVRDLVNTPAEHMGPAELAAAVKLVAKQHGAKVKETVGDALLKAGFPAVHAVGRASTRAPRLIELSWGNPKHPKLSLVGKGVCFDTGGLDLKSAEGMRLMKKDMGGAANALGLARW